MRIRRPNSQWDAFTAYVTDAATEMLHADEGGLWNKLDEALAWARARANQVVLTYGFTHESVFSAGADYYDGGDTAHPLPVWPPGRATISAIDNQVGQVVEETPPPATSDQLGVTEPEVREEHP